MAAIEFWFEFASTYSHPAAQRIARHAAERGLGVIWRPFLLGPIFAAQGWNDSPLNLYPAKGEHMWRDLARVCEGHGVYFRRPSSFLRNGLLGARVCVAAEDQPWMPDFARSLYRANFVDDLDTSREDVVGRALRAVGQAAEPWLARAAEATIKTRLRVQTERAQSLGIFGAPSFIVGDELFWGDDRLEAALDHAAWKLW